MPSTFALPDYPVTVYGEAEKAIQISPGTGAVYVDGKQITGPVVVTKAVSLTGSGTVSTDEVPVPKKGKKK